MNILKRMKDFKLLSTESFVRNLKPYMRREKWIQQELSNRTAGYYGERNVDYMLRTYPDNSALALPDIRLNHKGFDFQLDNTILTHHCFVILETKNWAGELIYDPELRQLIQHHNGRKKRYPCPMAQAEKQKQNLSAWLFEHDLPVPPIETFIVISNPSTILSNPQQDEHFSKKFFHADLLHEKLDDLFANTSTRSGPSGTNQQIFNYIKNHQIQRFDSILTHANFSRNQLMMGIPCMTCWESTMLRHARNWHCQHCGTIDKHAHVQIIYDYFLLNGMRPVTNREIRSFLQIPSRKIVYKMLINMGLKMTGTRRHAMYHPPSLEKFPQHSNLPE